MADLQAAPIRRQFTFHSKRLFSKLDVRRKGTICVEDLCTHLDISNKEAEAMILETKNANKKQQQQHEADGKDQKVLTFAEFNQLLKISFGATVVDNDEMSNSDIRRYRAIFDSIDKDNSGTISVKELLGGLDENETNDILTAANIDETGELSFDQFLELMANASKANAKMMKNLLKDAPALRDLTDAIELDTAQIPESILAIWMKSRPDARGLAELTALQFNLEHAHRQGNLECSDDDLLNVAYGIQEYSKDRKISFEGFWRALCESGLELPAMANKDLQHTTSAQSWLGFVSNPMNAVASLDAVRSITSLVVPGQQEIAKSSESTVQLDTPIEHRIAPPENLRDFLRWMKGAASEGDATSKLGAIMQAMGESEEGQAVFLAIMQESDWAGMLALLSFTNRFDSPEMFEMLLQLVYVMGVLEPKAFAVMASQGFLRLCQRLLRVRGPTVGMLALHLLNTALAPDTSGLLTLTDAQIDASSDFVLTTAQLATTAPNILDDDDDDSEAAEIARNVAHEALSVLLRLDSEHGKESGYVVVGCVRDMGSVGTELLSKVVNVAVCGERGRFSVDDMLQCWRCVARILADSATAKFVFLTVHAPSLLASFTDAMQRFLSKRNIDSELNAELQCAMLFVVYGIFSGLESQQSTHALFEEIGAVKRLLVEVASSDEFEQRVAVLAVAVGVQLDRITNHLSVA